MMSAILNDDHTIVGLICKILSRIAGIGYDMLIYILGHSTMVMGIDMTTHQSLPISQQICMII